VTSSLSQGRSIAKAAEVASQMVRPARFAGMASPFGTRTPEVVPFQVKTTSASKFDGRQIDDLAVGGLFHGGVELELFHRVGDPAFAKGFPCEHLDRAGAEHRPHRHFDRAGVGAGDDADAVIGGDVQDFTGKVDGFLQLRLADCGAVRAAQGRVGEVVQGEARDFGAGARGEARIGRALGRRSEVCHGSLPAKSPSLGRGVPPPGIAAGAGWHKRENCPKAAERRVKTTQLFTIGNLMFIATLLTNPQTPILERATVEAVRNAWGGGDAVWLEPGVAAEFPLEAMPLNRWEVWDGLQGLRVDLVVQAAEGRRKRVLLADMDSTMIRQECIDELADEAGVGARVAEITKAAMNGELDFEGALRERVGLLKGLPVAVIDRVIRDRITLMPGGPQLVATMKANGAYAALVSGGFTAFTSRIAGVLGFDENRANTLNSNGDVLDGTVAEPILGRQAKVDALVDITKRLSIPEAAVMAVGDGANDLGMLKRAGAGVALHAKPVVAAECDIRINHGDLTALLFVQGYRREEFVA
jgi:phosphoserine phosphatase